MNNHSLTYMVFFANGLVFGYINSAIFPLSLAALLIRSRRRVLATAISTLSWIVLVTGTLLALAYLVEFFQTGIYERYTFFSRYSGIYAWSYWTLELVGILAPQLFWSRKCRTNAGFALAISAAILLSTNYESLVIYITSGAQQDFLPDSCKR